MTYIDSKGWYYGNESTADKERQRGRAIDRLASYEDTGLTPEEITDLQKTWGMYGGDEGIQDCINRLREIMEAEHDSRIIILPCKPGKRLWVESCIKGEVASFPAPDVEWIIKNMEGFGEEIFLNKEDAEKRFK